MKIKKGYTLSRFVDLQQQIIMSNTAICEPSDINSENVDDYNDDSIWAFGRIKKYNEFLKLPLKKEMFINEVVRPNAWTLYNMQPMECTADEMRLCREWQEAEKKVIFNGVQNKGDFIRISDECDIKFHKMGYIQLFDNLNIEDYSIRTIGELFYISCNSLKLQNVAI